MNKNVMALAVAGAMLAPAVALAQVEISGGINALYYQHDPKNPNNSSKTDILESSESELAIRGQENLGGGLSVWFQCATSIDGIFNGTATATAGMCTRNSALGFKGGFGNFFFGQWDTPSKLVQNQIRGSFSGTNALYGGGATLLWGGSSSGAANPVQTTTGIVSSVGGTATAQLATANGGAQASSFYRRQAQTLNYHSPNWGGFSLQAAYSAGNESTAFADTASPKLKPRLGGIAGNYNLGALWVGLALEQHKDYNPANLTQSAAVYNGGTDNNTTLGVGYTFAGRFKLRGAYSTSKYETQTGTNGAQELKVKGYALYSENNISGPHNLNFAWIQVKDTTGTAVNSVGSYQGPAAGITCGVTGTASCASNTGADVVTIVYAYDFSKRTRGLLAYDQMSNKNNAKFNMGKSTASLGGKQSSIGMAVLHKF